MQRIILLLAVLLTTVVHAKVLLSVDEALALAFPGCNVERETAFLTETELAAAEQLAGERPPSALVARHVATCEGRRSGTAYVDTHRVRTLEEALMVVVGADGTVERVEVLSFNEPPDYLPRDGWYRQFDGRSLDDELRLDRGIRAVTGATLTAQATTLATRRVLALHRVIGARGADR